MNQPNGYSLLTRNKTTLGIFLVLVLCVILYSGWLYAGITKMKPRLIDAKQVLSRAIELRQERFFMPGQYKSLRRNSRSVRTAMSNHLTSGGLWYPGRYTPNGDPIFLYKQDGNRYLICTTRTQPSEAVMKIERYFDQTEQPVCDWTELHVQIFPELVSIYEFVAEITPCKRLSLAGPFSPFREKLGQTPGESSVYIRDKKLRNWTNIGNMPRMEVTGMQRLNDEPSFHIGIANPGIDGVWYETTSSSRYDLATTGEGDSEYAILRISCRDKAGRKQ